MNVKEYVKKLIASFLVLLIVFLEGALVPISHAENQEVQLSISPKPKIDIVLSKARTKTDVTNFETDIKNALIARSIDPDDVDVSAVSAQQVNIETSFEWKRDVSSSIGTLTIANNGQNVNMTGNYSNPGKNAIWIEPDTNQEQKFTFGYSINFGDSFNAAGMLLRVKETDTTNHCLSGYALSFNYSGQFKSLSNANGAIWKFYYDGNNNTNMSITLVKALSISTSGTLTVSATDKEIKVSGGGLSSEVSCEIDENYTIGNGFGFFSDHYSHGCNNYGSFQLTGINLNAVTTKSFKEVLQLPDWRENSVRFLMNVDDYRNEELENSTAYSELLTKLLAEELHYVEWGNVKNKQQFEDLIASNNANGLFVNNSNYATAISTTADYIAEVVEASKRNVSQYVLANEPIEINVTPDGITQNTIDSEWPYGKWKIIHDYDYYENNIGQFANSGKYLNDLITVFDKSGKYEIQYRNIPVSPTEIFAHRKPFAEIQVARSGNNLTLTSSSYDLDEYSKANHGIAEEEWKWKTPTDATWNTGKLTTVDSTKEYIISLRVKDNQDTWSSIAASYITSDPTAPPVASFNIAKGTITNYENLSVRNTSYDPAGGTISTYTWEIYDDEDNLVYTGSSPKTNYLTSDVGEYTMYLTVTNARGYTSERFGRKFTVERDLTAPEVIVDPTECDWSLSKTVNLQFNDIGNSGVKNYKYAVTNSQATPTSWSSTIASDHGTVSFNTEGIYYLHVKSEDNAGNVSEDRITGPYKIDKSAPTIQVTADLTNDHIDTLSVNIKTTDSLSGIKKITLDGVNIIANQDVTFTKNGTYIIRAEDNLGNTSTRDIVINNIFYECNAGLEHPKYSSTYDSCPICKDFEGLAVTNNTKVYNGEKQGVNYSNPGNADIVEYYDDINDRKRNTGEYSYELYVSYNGHEYKTGQVGTFTITKKPITITGITTVTKRYDGNRTMAITGGTLNGTIDEDDVRAIIPETGEAESQSPGTWKVQIDDIEIVGEDKDNYSLAQPEYGSIEGRIIKSQADLVIQCPSKIYDKRVPEPSKVTGQNTSEVKYRYYNKGSNTEIDPPVEVGEYEVEGYQDTDGNFEPAVSNRISFTIGKKELSINGIKATSKSYDGSDIVEITDGRLSGVVQGDDVTPIIPTTGRSESEIPGNWSVRIDKVRLSGEDSKNYYLVQPEYGTIDVTIVRAKSTLEIDCESKVYDKKTVDPEVIKSINSTEVKFIYYRKGDDSPIKAPRDVGEYEVEAYQENDDRYQEVRSERISFSITPKKIQIEDIVANGKDYDGSDQISLTGGKLIGILSGDSVKAVIPDYGKAESSEPGTWRVIMDDITLKGRDAENYELEQLEKGELTVTIHEPPRIMPDTGTDSQLIITIIVSILGAFIAIRAIIKIRKTK